jgi:hypothetical protein
VAVNLGRSGNREKKGAGTTLTMLSELLPKSWRKPGRPSENPRDVINGIL